MPKRLHYYTCDVFTERRFGGNQLAVFPDAAGLSDQQMQEIANEMNYSETTFCLPPSNAEFLRKVRIFTPVCEVPFAGHPNVGTAFVLASTGDLGAIPKDHMGLSITFEEEAGPVPITIQRVSSSADGSDRLTCELKAPQPLSKGNEIPVEKIAEILTLSLADIDTEPHTPIVASVGLSFVMVRVKNVETLGRIKMNLPAMERLVDQEGFPPYVHVYTHVGGGGGGGDDAKNHRHFDLRARMFAPTDNIPEDPATGSANAALVALLTSLLPSRTGTTGADCEHYTFTIQQGVEMGRPSTLYGRTARNSDGLVSGVWIKGSCVMVCEGWMEVQS